MAHRDDAIEGRIKGATALIRQDTHELDSLEPGSRSFAATLKSLNEGLQRLEQLHAAAQRGDPS